MCTDANSNGQHNCAPERKSNEQAARATLGEASAYLHEQGCTDGSTNTNELDMSRFQLPMSVVGIFFAASYASSDRDPADVALLNVTIIIWRPDVYWLDVLLVALHL